MKTSTMKTERKISKKKYGDWDIKEQSRFPTYKPWRSERNNPIRLENLKKVTGEDGISKSTVPKQSSCSPYEYHQVDSKTNVFQEEIDESNLETGWIHQRGLSMQYDDFYCVFGHLQILCQNMAWKVVEKTKCPIRWRYWTQTLEEEAFKS